MGVTLDSGIVRKFKEAGLTETARGSAGSGNLPLDMIRQDARNMDVVLATAENVQNFQSAGVRPEQIAKIAISGKSREVVNAVGANAVAFQKAKVSGDQIRGIATHSNAKAEVINAVGENAKTFKEAGLNGEQIAAVALSQNEEVVDELAKILAEVKTIKNTPAARPIFTSQAPVGPKPVLAAMAAHRPGELDLKKSAAKLTALKLTDLGRGVAAIAGSAKTAEEVRQEFARWVERLAPAPRLRRNELPLTDDSIVWTRLKPPGGEGRF